MKLIFCIQINMKVFDTKIFDGDGQTFPKVFKIASLQCLWNISKKKLEIKLIFCM